MVSINRALTLVPAIQIGVYLLRNWKLALLYPGMLPISILKYMWVNWPAVIIVVTVWVLINTRNR